MERFDPSAFSLKGRLALVTGSSRGLGTVLAAGLAAAGARLVINGRNGDTVAKTAAAFRADGVEVFESVFDVTKEQEVAAAIEVIESEAGPIGILVNNAGVQVRAPLEQFKVEDWDYVLDINLKGAFVVSKHVAQKMISRKSGKIVSICSMQSRFGRRTIAPYAASKGGLAMLTRGMAVDWAQHNIQANGLAPGYFITEMTQPLADNPEFDAWLKNRTPAHRWGDPQELLGALVFLASPASNFVNGQILYVDGGIHAAI
jgi:gluconate 5-dehydrogenase